MTPDEARKLRPDDIVTIRWPGSNTGNDTKFGKVVRVNTAGTKVGLLVARKVTEDDEGFRGIRVFFGSSLRWFGAEDVESL